MQHLLQLPPQTIWRVALGILLICGLLIQLLQLRSLLQQEYQLQVLTALQINPDLGSSILAEAARTIQESRHSDPAPKDQSMKDPSLSLQDEIDRFVTGRKYAEEDE